MILAAQSPLPRYDALVIGGGPAGLTGALYLARFRRHVLLVDEGGSRAARIPRSHNYPGFVDGVPGGELVAAMRRHAEQHRVNFAHGRVSGLARDGQGLFVARWEGGAACAPCVLLSTGTSDIPPAMPHLARALQDGVLRYCPVCDGFEVIDQSVGVITNSPSGVEEALYLRHFTDRITLFAPRDHVALTDKDRGRLAEAGVGVCTAVVDDIVEAGAGVTLHHDQGVSEVQCLYGSLGMNVHTDLARSLGADHDDDGYLLTDRHYRTSVPGLYAAGDVVKGLNQITVATGTAAIAAAAMHRSLPSAGLPPL